jgi:hypothetical protein
MPKYSRFWETAAIRISKDRLATSNAELVKSRPTSAWDTERGLPAARAENYARVAELARCFGPH